MHPSSSPLVNCKFSYVAHLCMPLVCVWPLRKHVEASEVEQEDEDFEDVKEYGDDNKEQMAAPSLSKYEQNPKTKSSSPQATEFVSVSATVAEVNGLSLVLLQREAPPQGTSRSMPDSAERATSSSPMKTLNTPSNKQTTAFKANFERTCEPASTKTVTSTKTQTATTTASAASGGIINDGSFSGKTFVFTGVLIRLNQDSAERVVNAYGGKVLDGFKARMLWS